MRILLSLLTLIFIGQTTIFTYAQARILLVAEVQIDGQITQIEWHPNQPLIAMVTSNSSSVMLFDVTNNQVISTLESNTEASLIEIEWSNSGDFIAGLSGNHMVEIWDTRTNEVIKSINLNDLINRPIFSSTYTDLTWGTDDEVLMIVDDLHLVIFDIKDNVVSGVPSEIIKIEWLPQAEIFVSISSNGSVIMMSADRKTQVTIEYSDLFSNQRGLASSELVPMDAIVMNGAIWVAFAINDSNREVHNIAIFNGTAWELRNMILDHQATIWDLAWSPDGRFLASSSGDIFMANGDADNTFHIYDAQTFELIYKSENFSSPVTSLTWRADGSHLAISTWDGTLQLWEILD